MLFGQYLILVGRARPDQVLAALDKQLLTTPFIGQIAVEAGLMNAEQVLAVLDHQAISGRPFAAQAVDLGYIRREHVVRLNMLQEQRTTPIGEILVRDGVLARAELPDLLRAFHAANAHDETTLEIREKPVAGR